MNPLEIVLIIIGIIVIIVSCLLVDKSAKKANNSSGQTFSLESSISEEDKNKLIEKINEQLSELSEETVIRTDDSLSRLSNEKIMAVNEFSEQILEKIKRNHDEVVFLYNMLNDKEKELKSAVKEIDSSKKKVQDIMEAKANAEKTQTAKGVKPDSTEKAGASNQRTDKQMKALSRLNDVEKEITTIDSLNSNNNTQILALYSQGKSVMEISKLLGLGQGEVKLVIDLYKGKK